MYGFIAIQNLIFCITISLISEKKTKSFYNSVQFSDELIGLIFIKNKRFFNNEVFI